MHDTKGVSLWKVDLIFLHAPVGGISLSFIMLKKGYV